MSGQHEFGSHSSEPQVFTLHYVVKWVIRHQCDSPDRNGGNRMHDWGSGMVFVDEVPVV